MPQWCLEQDASPTVWHWERDPHAHEYRDDEWDFTTRPHGHVLASQGGYTPTSHPSSQINSQARKPSADDTGLTCPGSVSRAVINLTAWIVWGPGPHSVVARGQRVHSFARRLGQLEATTNADLVYEPLCRTQSRISGNVCCHEYGEVAVLPACSPPLHCIQPVPPTLACWRRTSVPPAPREECPCESPWQTASPSGSWRCPQGLSAWQD